MVNEADDLAPSRSIASDGSIGDTSHAARLSFHNPENGFVDALDLTHDPMHGWDVHARARELIRRGDDRLDHVISNAQIWSAARPYWRSYTGSNSHTQHAHFATKRTAAGRTVSRIWWPQPTDPPDPPVVVPPIVIPILESDSMFTYEYVKLGTASTVLLVMVHGGKQMFLTGQGYLDARRKVGAEGNHFLFQSDEVARAARTWGPIVT